LKNLTNNQLIIERIKTNMSKFEYTEEMVDRMHVVAKPGLTEETIEALMTEFDFPRRSVTAKLRKLGYDVPKKPGAAPVFSAEESEELSTFLDDNSGVHTAEEIAAHFSDAWGREVTARQINGKALSLEMTGNIKPAEKKTYPIRWLIVVVSTISTFLLAIVVVLILENIRRMRNNIKVG
jgi:hypothetical protein